MRGGAAVLRKGLNRKTPYHPYQKPPETGPDSSDHSPLILSFQQSDKGWKREAPSQSKQKTAPHAAQNFLVRKLLPAKQTFTSL